MTTTVQIAFDLSANGIGNYFTLDDATKGVLDNATYKLGGDVLVDVTQYVRGVGVKRGRSTMLDRFTTGTANVTLDNRARVFDPLNTASAYYGSIIPGKEVVITRDAYPIYTGNIADWNFSYTIDNDATAELAAVDGLAILAGQTRTAGTATAQLTGARVTAILTEAGWPLTERVISTGQATLDADVVPATENVLGYLQKVETSEPGALFASKTGAIVFKDRAALQLITAGVTFGDSNSDIRFTNIGVVFGSEELANSINVSYTSAGTVAGTVNVTDSASVTKYGTIDKTYATLLGSGSDSTALANWLIGLYSEPRYRIDSITVNLAGISQVAQVLALELGDVVTVKWTPNLTGAQISQIVSIDAIEHAIGVDRHEVTFTLSEAAAGFILDDAVYGVLDSSILGF